MTKKELKQLIREVAGADDLKFTTPINIRNVYINLSREEKLDNDVEVTEAIVEWELDIDSRNWGIKGMTAFIKGVRISYTINDSEKEVVYSVGNTAGYTIDTNFISNKYGAYVPQEITLDKVNKTITIDF
jgi:hypothetical protein